MTFQELGTAALEEIGVLGGGETASAEDAEVARLRANAMIDAWNLDRLWLHTVIRTTKTLAAGTASYSIGAGCSIDIVQPVWIDCGALVINTGAAIPTEVPLEQFTDQRWQLIAMKTLQSGLSQGFYYDHGSSPALDVPGGGGGLSPYAGLIYPWPIPNVGTTQLVLYAAGDPVVAFADLSTDYTFPKGYQEALRYNLAVRLTVPFGRPLNNVLATMATESLARVKRANHRPVELGCEAGVLGRGGRVYDIRTNR